MKDRKRFLGLRTSMLEKVAAIKADIFQHVTGKRLEVRESIIISDAKFRTIVEVVERETGVQVMDQDRDLSTLKINAYRFVNKDWLRKVTKLRDSPSPMGGKDGR